ncbi:MAG: filamentous hemagglutinin N-terminal domain-containing protein, partial [Paucibacter sp.]|nr:filamentous hemagglutinin N-terminal domain-containing protein [Roseateles sp.]
MSAHIKTAHRPAADCLRMTPVCIAALLATGAAPLAQALPQGGQVVAGAATINTPGAGQMLIQQSSDKASIDWRSFSIGTSESLRITQPSSSSVLVNRVSGGDASQILGRIAANGRVFLSNPRGIVFGRDAVVDVGGLVATTLAIAPKLNEQGGYNLVGGADGGAEIIVDGQIHAPGGTVVFAGPQVSLNGQIEARRVAAAAVNAVQIDIDGDGLVFFNPRNDEQLQTKLKVLGSIKADGGTVDLRAAARAGLADTVLNMDGIVQARSLGSLRGQVFIDGGSSGNSGDTLVTGKIDVSGQASGERGGEVRVLGQRVGLFGAAQIDAGGAGGGGSILVGGNWQGGGDERRATDTRIGTQASLSADATERGDGGTIVVWSDRSTVVGGVLSARGGSTGGNGGSIETSSKGTLGLDARVDVSAAKGQGGQWLLDPNDITIAGAGANFVESPANTFSDNGGTVNATINAASINAALVAGSTVTVQTSGTGSAPGAFGDITVAADINPTLAAASGSLNLIAHRNVVISNTIAKLGAGAGVLNLGVYAGAGTAGSVATIANAGTQAGTISIGAAINLPGGTVVLQARDGVSMSAAALTAADLQLRGAGTFSLTNAGNNVATLGVAAGSGAVTYVDSNALTATLTAGRDYSLTASGNLAISGAAVGLTGSSTGTTSLGATAVSGNLNLSSGGAISQSGVLSVTGTTTISAAGQTVTLDNNSNDFGGAVTASGAAISLTDANNLSAALTASGAAVLSSVAGDITASGTALSLNAGGVNVSSAVATTNNSTLTASAAASNSASVGGTLSIMAAGAAGNTGAITGAATLTSSGAAAVSNAANVGGLLSTSGGATTISGASIGSLSVNSTTLSFGATGISNSASITATGAVGQTAATALTVGTTTTISAAGQTVVLAETGNDFSGTVTASSAAITLADANGLTAALTASGSASLSSVAGDVTASGTALSLNAGGVNVS